MRFIVQMPDPKASFFLESAKNLKFVKVAPAIIDADYGEPDREHLKAEIRQAVKEENRIKQGKMQGCSVEDLLNEL